jgi:hypothetical protein
MRILEDMLWFLVCAYCSGKYPLSILSYVRTGAETRLSQRKEDVFTGCYTCLTEDSKEAVYPV